MLPKRSTFSSAGLPTLRLSPGATTVVAAGRSPFTLRGREALRRIVEALVRARRVAEGSPVSVDRLFEAGWPSAGASLSETARAQRVYAAISRLRRLGLYDVIERNDDGYFIDAKWRIEVDPSPHVREAYGLFGEA